MAIFEMVRRGRFLKVTVIDEATGLEATIIADPAAPKTHIEQLALQKLRYVLEKHRNQ